MQKSKLRNNCNKKPRVAILVNAFWNSGAGTSGGDQRVAEIFSRIEKDFQIDIYTSIDGKKVLGEKIKSAKFFLSPKKYQGGNVLLCYRRRANWLIGELNNREYDIIYSSSDFFPDVLPAYEYKSKHSRAVWVACIFHIYPDWQKRPGNKIVNLVGSKIQNFSFNKIKKSADKIININFQVRDELIKKYHFNKNKIVVNPCGIDLNYFKNIKAKKNAGQACFIARLVPSKGIFDLPKIWLEVINKIPTAKLKIIGGGNEEVKLKLKELFREKNMENNVEILGFLPSDETYKILKESEVFVFPSHEEGFGMAIAEALASETPAVAWNLSVYKEVFPKGVIQIQENNYCKFADEIVKLFGNSKKRAKLANDGADMVKRYSWGKIADSEKIILFDLKNDE